MNPRARPSTGKGASAALKAIAILLGLIAIIDLGAWLRDLMHIATGSVSHALCSATFVSGLDPSQVYTEEELPANGMRLIDWALHYDIDRRDREGRTSILGGFGARSVYRPGIGCLLIQDDSDRALRVGLAPPGFTSAFPSGQVIEPKDRALNDALAKAFAEPSSSQLRRTKAVVVLHDGQIIAERYAPGFGPDTPLWGHSLSKSITNALIGILVQRGKLRLGQSPPIAAWQLPRDPRRRITIDQLLRMSSGLPFDETNLPVNLATRMWFLQRDMAEFAEHTPLAHPPGHAWGYSNLSFLILSRVVRDTVGGGPLGAEQFARDALFSPLGMRSAVIECDATGTLLGAAHTFASARDYARFGQLFVDDGVVNGTRLLPKGWAAYSASQTLNTGYGAGFWTNLVNAGSVPVWDATWGMPLLPKDMFYARGGLGQLIVIVPSERLVVTRFGYTHDTGAGMGPVIADIITALHSGKQP